MLYPSFGFNLMSLVFPLMFLLVFGMIAFTIIQELRRWNKNNNSPRLTVEAKIISKRSDIRRIRSGTNNMHSHSHTDYYVTFEVESGDRMELELQGHEYGLLMEGDKGKLTFQGTRYLGFERM